MRSPWLEDVRSILRQNESVEALDKQGLFTQAVRNFVQLCLEGYYDNTPFFRIDKGFMAQAGDPTGTGLGGESVYGHPFNDEFHSRLKFNHRSVVRQSLPS